MMILHTTLIITLDIRDFKRPRKVRRTSSLPGTSKSTAMKTSSLKMRKKPQLLKKPLLRKVQQLRETPKVMRVMKNS